MSTLNDEVQRKEFQTAFLASESHNHSDRSFDLTDDGFFIGWGIEYRFEGWLLAKRTSIESMGPVVWPHEITVADIEQLISDHQRDGKNHLASSLDCSGSYLIRVAESLRWCLDKLAAPASLGEAKAVAKVYTENFRTSLTEWLDDSRDLPDGDHTLYAAPVPQALPVGKEALNELIAQAQELDMGYGVPVAAEKDVNITLTGHQIAELLDLAAPDRETDPDQLETEMTLTIGDESAHSGPGLYAYWTDYPEEGAVALFEIPDDDDDVVGAMQGEKA